ncbi:hypothetical protein [Maridesulfovibrio salexigens]|nr:hypothetical protein [Maridesulfovibrio salexigens]
MSGLWADGATIIRRPERGSRQLPDNVRGGTTAGVGHLEFQGKSAVNS